jgi:serine/threonine protein kinase
VTADTVTFGVPAAAGSGTASFHPGVGRSLAHDATVTRAPSADAPLPQPDSPTLPEAERAEKLPTAPTGYELIRKLDSGGMGVVYLARDVVADHIVALKVLREAANPELVERFLQEVRALSRVDHPNIVRVFSHDFYRSDPFFTMEYAPGGALSDHMKKKGPVEPLEPKEAARIMAIVARAMHAAHMVDVIHRDLKPSNILLMADGTPKVADFGLAKRTDDDANLTTRSGAIGTPGYMPPEQISRTRFGAITTRADVYGLGATLYHLVTGRAPFVGDQVTILTQIPTELPPRVRSLRPEVPLALEGIVHKCLEKNPADRYETAAALADDLEKFRTDLVPDAPQLTRWRRLRRWALRNRGRIAAAGTATVAACVLVWVGVLLAGQGKPPETPPPPNPVEVARKELDDGKAVEWIRDGKPLAYRWRIGSGDLGTPPNGDKDGCYFDTSGTAAIDFFPHVGLKRYRVTAALKHHQGPGETNPSAAATVMLYVANDPIPGNDSLIVHPLVGVGFNDFEPPALGRSPPRKERLAVLWDRLVCQQPPNPIRRTKDRLAELPFVPDSIRPGPTRTVRLDVTEKAIAATWLTKSGEWVPFKPTNGANTAATWQQRNQKQIDQMFPQSGVAFPPWSSEQFSVGVLSETAGVAIHSLVIEPIP